MSQYRMFVAQPELLVYSDKYTNAYMNAVKFPQTVSLKYISVLFLFEYVSLYTCNTIQ